MKARKIKGTEHLHGDVCHRKRVDLERLAEKDNLAKIFFNVYHTRFSGYQWYCESLERLADQDNLVNMFHFIKYFTGYQMLCVFRIIWHNKEYHITYFEKHEPFSIGKFLPLSVYYISKKIEQYLVVAKLQSGEFFLCLFITVCLLSLFKRYMQKDFHQLQSSLVGCCYT